MKTYQDVFTFRQVASTWLSAHKDESKFAYALRKVVKQCQPLVVAYQEHLEDLDIEYCSTGDKDVILTDDKGGMVYTKENLRKRNAARRALFMTLVEVTPYLAASVPEDLSEAEREVLAGFVLPEQTIIDP
jgi:hypothetical protein